MYFFSSCPHLYQSIALFCSKDAGVEVETGLLKSFGMPLPTACFVRRSALLAILVQQKHLKGLLQQHSITTLCDTQSRIIAL